MKKLLEKLKAFALFIKKIIKKVLQFVTRFAYIFLAIGYIGSFATAYFAQDYIKNYNSQAIYYTKKANDGFKSYEAVKNIDKIVGSQLNRRYKETEKAVISRVNDINEKKLAQELLFGKDLKNTSLVKDVNQVLKNGFQIDTSREVRNIINKQQSHPVLTQILNIFESSTLVHIVLLLLTFPAFSPIVLGILILMMVSKKYLRKLCNPNENNYIMMLPSIYITNLLLAFACLAGFYYNMRLGIAIAVIAHVLFIWKVINGILLRNTGVCLSCGQSLEEKVAEPAETDSK